jgi:hypothetical protein
MEEMKSNPPIVIRQSLIVGINNYSCKSDKYYMNKQPNLSMSHKDANRMMDYLKHELDWP